MRGKESVQQVQKWWASNPMTYGAVHGKTEFDEGSYKPGTIEFFNRLDEEFYSWNYPYHNEKPFGRLFPYEQYSNNSHVLEVGCGLGTMAMNWARQGVKLAAVDLNPTSIEQTLKRFSLHQLTGDIRLADARVLPFENESFDYVYSWGVLHHSPDLSESISELMRTLKQGGGFGIMLYNRQSMLYRYTIKYLEGFLHYENRFLGPLELASRYGDGDREEGNPHTWPVTTDEAFDLLQLHSADVHVKRLGTDLDERFKLMLPFLGRYLPQCVLKSWARRYGWSLWIYGTKR